MPAPRVEPVPAVVGERLTLEAFQQLSGNLAGYPFVKVVVDRESGVLHFLNHSIHEFHADYIAARILSVPQDELDARLDEFNRKFYLDADRRFFLGILSLHGGEKRFLSLETVEIDTMSAEMVREFYAAVRKNTDQELPLYFKPANHLQDAIVAGLAPSELPRVFHHEIFSTASFVPLNPGVARGRIRSFKSEEAYRSARSRDEIRWHDILVMERVPDDIPRVSGMINAGHTTPLSHTNVLAAGWKSPNCVQIGALEWVSDQKLEGEWVEYEVSVSASRAALRRLEGPFEIPKQPAWSLTKVKLEEPEVANVVIGGLEELRATDRARFGTKAANLGELHALLARPPGGAVPGIPASGNERLLGFYRIRRPPRENLLPHLREFLGVAPGADAARAAWEFLRTVVRVPQGLAIPFAVQQEFLESSPRIQQMIGKLKMALELGAPEVDALCLELQKLIRQTRMPDALRERIDSQIASRLAGVRSFVVRSSSNAEDLQGFSAAGIYESKNRVTTADRIFESIKDVWASLVSPRSVRLRQEVGISLDDSYMGVIVQEEVETELGGVLVTTNPMNRAGDFRNVYINASHSSSAVVTGETLPYQFLFNTVEGGGRTISIGSAARDLSEAQKALLQKLAVVGRLLQSHFSPDYTFSAPLDIEWAAARDTVWILQIRPYAV